MFKYRMILSIICCISASMAEDISNTAWQIWPRNPDVTVIKNAGEVQLNVPEQNSNPTLYASMKLPKGKRCKLTFEYSADHIKSTDDATQNAGVSFYWEDGNKKSSNIAFKLTIDPSNPGAWQPFSREFSIPDKIVRMQIQLIVLKATSGKFRFRNISLSPVDTDPVDENKDDNTPYLSNIIWRLWPRNASGEVNSIDKEVLFRVENPDNQILYANLDLPQTRRCKLTFEYSGKNLRFGNTPEQKVGFYFFGEKGPGSGGIITFPLSFDTAGWHRFSQEFTIPDKITKAQFQLLALKQTAGEFYFRKIAILPVADEQTIAMTGTPKSPDGNPNKAPYDKLPQFTDFYTVDSSPQPAEAKTQVFISYDRNNLAIAVKCFDPAPSMIAAKVEPGKDPVFWTDDYLEVFLGTENGPKRQYAVTPANARWDGELIARIPGDPYLSYAEWDGQWQSATQRTADGWNAEFIIPFSDLEFTPDPGDKLHLNLVRGRRGSAKETVQLNFHDQEQNNFRYWAELFFSDNDVLLKRYRQQSVSDPLKIVRTPLQQDQISFSDGHYIVSGSDGSFLLVMTGKKFQNDNAASWPEKVKTMYRRMADAGLTMPHNLPWAPNYFGGKAGLEQAADEYNFKFMLAGHTSAHDREAIAAGAQLHDGKSSTAADPLLGEIQRKSITEYIRNNQWVKPYVMLIRDFDEPTNSLFNIFSFKKNRERTAALNRVDEQIRTSTGFGKYGMYDIFADNTDSDASFRSIAFIRWWNDQFLKTVAANRACFAEELPGVPYMPAVINTVVNFRGTVSIPELAEYADVIGIDPYPMATLVDYSPERALYHTGFSTKMAKDLSGKKPVFCYIQAFKYRGRIPSQDHVAEWTAQGLKNGADYINWYAAGNMETCPEIFDKSVELTSRLTKMKKLALPAHSRSAILYSYMDAWGNFDQISHKSYTVYALLGEKLRSSFDMISDIQIERKNLNLESYKLIIAPSLTFVDKKTLDELEKFVTNGGTLVLLDPESISFGPDGSDLSSEKSRLAGVTLAERSANNKIIADAMTGVEQGAELPLSPLENVRNGGRIQAYNIQPSPQSTVIANYPDGHPAATVTQYGKGKVYFFGAQPFGNSSLAARNSPWVNFFQGLLKEIEEPQNLEIWNFQL